MRQQQEQREAEKRLEQPCEHSAHETPAGTLPDIAGMALTDGCPSVRTEGLLTSSSIGGVSLGQQHRQETLESDDVPADSAEAAVLTGGTTVPGHHYRMTVRGLDRIQGTPSDADRKRRCERTAADGPADGVAIVVAGQVGQTKPEATAKKRRIENSQHLQHCTQPG